MTDADRVALRLGCMVPVTIRYRDKHHEREATYTLSIDGADRLLVHGTHNNGEYKPYKHEPIAFSRSGLRGLAGCNRDGFWWALCAELGWLEEDAC